MMRKSTRMAREVVYQRGVDDGQGRDGAKEDVEALDAAHSVGDGAAHGT